MDIIDQSRRKWLGIGAATIGLSLLPSHVFAAMTTLDVFLRFQNNTGESLKTEFLMGAATISLN